MAEPIRSSKGNRTRRGILGAAERLFGVHGYHGTSMSDVLDATSLTKGALYHHFRSKQDLALALLEQARNKWEEQVVAPAMENQEPRQQLVALLEGAAGAEGRVPSSYLVVASFAGELTEQDRRLWDAARELQGAMVEVWRTVIAEGQAQGQLRADVRADTLAHWIVAGLMGAALADKLAVGPEGTGWLLDACKQLLLE